MIPMQFPLIAIKGVFILNTNIEADGISKQSAQVIRLSLLILMTLCHCNGLASANLALLCRHFLNVQEV